MEVSEGSEIDEDRRGKEGESVVIQPGKERENDIEKRKGEEKQR